MEPQTISIKGAREHNLRGLSLELPRNRLICFTGVSGSGKSSLAFDTLYAEGQRRYLESLSSYARQFLGQLAKPDVDQISGLSPSISIQQKAGAWNPRSTVATVAHSSGGSGWGPAWPRIMCCSWLSRLWRVNVPSDPRTNQRGLGRRVM